MPESFISVGDIKIVSKGGPSDTFVYFIDKDGKEHPIRTVTDAQWHLSVEDAIPRLYLTVAIPNMELTLPAEFVELVKDEQIIFIRDVTPWYVVLFQWWKKGWTWRSR